MIEAIRCGTSRATYAVALLAATLSTSCGPQEVPTPAAGPPPTSAADAGKKDAAELEPVVQIGHPRPLRHVVFSPDRKCFLTTAQDYIRHDGRVMLWDVATGDKLREFAAVTHGLEPQFCLEGRAVVIGGNVWDVQTGRPLHTVLEADQVPRDAQLSVDGRRLIVGTRGGKVRAVDLETGAEVASLSTSDLVAAPEADDPNGEEVAPQHAPSLMAVGFTAAGVPLALLGDSRTDRAAVWNVATRQMQAEMKPHYRYSGELSPDGNYVIFRWDDTNDSSESAAIYDARTGRKVTEWTAAVIDWSRMSPVEFTPDGHHCLIRDTAKEVMLIDLATGRHVHRFGGHAEPIITMRLRADGKTLETRSRDVAQRWDVESGKLLAEFRNSDDVEPPKRHWRSRRVQTGVTPSPDGTTFLFGQRLCEAATGKLRHSLEPLMALGERISSHAGSVLITHSEYLPGGKFVLVAWRDSYGWSQAAVFDVASGKRVKLVALVPAEWPFGLQWSRDGSRALTRPDGVHRLWDVARGRPLQTIGRVAKRTFYPLPRIAFSPNGRFVYTHGRQFGVFFWDAETGTAWQHDPPGRVIANQRGLLDGRRHGSYYLGRSAVSPDGRFAASWYQLPEDRKHKMLVWNIDRGRIAKTLDHAPLTPIGPFFSPDGRYLAVVCSRADQKVVTWDLQSGKRLHSLSLQKGPHARGPASVRFLAGGKRMLVNSALKELALYEVATGKLIHRMVDTRPKPEHQMERILRESLLLSPDERYVVADYSSEYAIVWDFQTGESKLLIERDMGNIPVTSFFQFSDDGRKLLTRYRPGQLWDLESGGVDSLTEREAQAELAGFSKREPAARAGTVGDRQAVPREILDRFKDRIPETARGVETTADGRRLIVYHDDFRIAVWDIATGKPVRDCYLLHNGGRWLTVMPDGTCRGNLEYVRYRKRAAE